MTDSDSALLDPAFLARLGKLRLLVGRRYAGSAGGSRVSVRRGSSVEFADHRPYAAGDDIRRIDWNAYARLDELVLRLYSAEEDIHVYLLLDTSASLSVGDPSKLEVARRVAAALGYLGLLGSERVSVQPYAASLGRPLEAMRGRRKVGALMRYLVSLTPQGGTDLYASVERFLAQRPRAGLVVLLTDLLDRGGYERAIDRLLAARFEVALFHVMDAAELSPPLGGDLSLVDAETGAEVAVTLDERALRAYRGRLEAFLAGARDYCRRRGVRYVLVPDAAFEDALMRYLRSAS
ncbi:MAG: DUF58 domain-containing protein [Polyangiales bacterium]|nr:DUF58 domain-containing protein [Myxococcales bacterium]MCB9657898.1 DUF58 domain-containing protein [Sandaracinaceae bacterium]